MALQDFDYVAITVQENGQSVDKWLAVTYGAGCDSDSSGNADTMLIYDTFPEAPAGFQVKNRDCGTVEPSNETEVVYVNPPGGSGQPDAGATQITTGNQDVLMPVVTWQNGKARISNGVTPTVPSGKYPFYFIDGQPASDALPTGYVYSPGDEVSIFFAIAASNDIYQSAFDTKGTATIKIGNAPA